MSLDGSTLRVWGCPRTRNRFCGGWTDERTTTWEGKDRPGFTGCTWTFSGCAAWGTCVNKRSAISFLVYFFEIYDKFVGVVFGEGEDLGAKEGENMI